MVIKEVDEGERDENFFEKKERKSGARVRFKS
jgi:hypothetical protein